MKRELKNILVPVDFKGPSLEAVNYACKMAFKLNAEIILLHVIQTPGIIAELFSSGENLVNLTNKVKDKLTELEHVVKNKKSGLKVTNRVEKGKPYEKILQVATQVNARMIILGENHQGIDADQDLGSTVYHVTLKSPVPVLTMKGNVERINESIVVPLDLTRRTRRQLYSAMVYGLNYGATIHLVSVLIGGIKMEDSLIYKKLEQAKGILEENGVNSTLKLFPRTEVPPFRKIIRYSKEIDAGMILLMTHEEGYTYDNYIGAFAHHIINKSLVPVLSLTSAASNIDFGRYLKGIVDPAGILLK